MLRLRVALRDYFPAALEAFKPLGLTSGAVLTLLVKAPTPAAAGKLTISQISAALKGRRDILAKASRPVTNRTQATSIRIKFGAGSLSISTRQRSNNARTSYR